MFIYLHLCTDRIDHVTTTTKTTTDVTAQNQQQILENELDCSRLQQFVSHSVISACVPQCKSVVVFHKFI